ncbi:putative transporter SEO1 [Wickerhamomyces ciferrii]|uniref:Transporter SEO1 n=1 Tax=Wickerhamomyces ciferrii (strain ATCC 14091 / BCRC 22168 / CBS 111 / JCM 3599 / NBRC 0793 / NRRL Y-1031 F-60-10) TaxID=1206466 RepID=K0KJP9_WICCF|nr:putative transporter SEO1 [Wickerhamomyces ciferrii]CCH43186.1 putative transporter SEO1 [Wickerhamomyces ciferrii]
MTNYQDDNLGSDSQQLLKDHNRRIESVMGSESHSDSLEIVGKSRPAKDYSAWYWKLIPHERHVEDWADDYEDDKLSIHSESTVVEYEYRDEANRPWWKFFDEYEYRYNKQTREQKKWYKFFDSNASVTEKKLLFKLDLLIVTFAVMSYWSKNLDQSNVSNAFVSGMREDLNMVGNDYSNTVALFNAGTVIFQIIFTWLFPRIDMHLMFFLSDVGWSLVTLCTGFVRNPAELKACRFLVGAFESGYFIMIHYLLGSWYKPDELGRRGGVFYCGQMLGQLTSGLLQAQIYQNLDSAGGRAGWRWMFIIDGAATMTIGFFAFYMVPGTPNKCTSLFLTDDEIRLSRYRLKKANIKPPSKEPPKFFDKKLWINILSSWRIYVLAVLDYLFWNTGNSGYSNFALWLKSLKRYSIPRINRFTSIPPSLGIIWILAVCGSADMLKSRSFAIFWAEIFVFIGSVILSIWDVPEPALWYAFYTNFFSISVSSVVYGWINDIMRYDPQERSIVLCFVNIFANQSTAWTGPLVYKTVDAPRYHKGYIYSASNSAALMIWSWVTLWFYKRQEKRDAKTNGIILYNSKTGDIPLEVRQHLNGEVEGEDEIEDEIEETSLGKKKENVEVKSFTNRSH